MPLPKDAVPDALLPPKLKDVRVNGPIGAKFDRFMYERCLSENARNEIVKEAREAFASPDDDVFRVPLGMWKGEFWGKLMISAARVAEYKNDEKLLCFLRDEAHRLIAYQRPDGYLGTYVDPEFVSPVKPAEHCWNLWCRKYTMWGLLMIYRATGDREVLDAASRAMKQQIEMLRRLGVRLCDTGTYPMVGMPSCSILKPLVMLYRETGDALFLDYAREIVSYWDRPGNPPPNFFQNVETGRPVSEWYVEEADRWGKAYEMMSCLDGVLEFYRLTGEKRCLDMVKKMQDNLWKTERNPLESVGYNDRFTGAARYLNGTSEPCDTIHWMRLNLDLYLITGEKRYADVIEAAFYNAFLAGVFRDGKWGAREVRSHGRHVARFGQSGMSHQHCCVNNMPRAFMDIAQFGVIRERVGGALRVNLYSPSVTKFDDAVVTLKGDFPVGDEASVVVEAKRSMKLKLRVPPWSGRSVFRTASGREVAVSENAAWHEMDISVGTTEVVVAFDMSPRLVESALEPSERRDDFRFKRWVGGGKDFASLFRTTPAARLFRGPLLLAKAKAVGDEEGDILRSDMNDGGWRVCLRRIESDAVMGAWDAVFTRGGQEYRTRVCDFASAGDSLLPEGSVAFSIFF